MSRVTGSVTGVLKSKPQPSCPLAWVCLRFCRRLRASPSSGPVRELPTFHHLCWVSGEGSLLVIFSLSSSLEDSEVRGGAAAGAGGQGGGVPLHPRGQGPEAHRLFLLSLGHQAWLLPARPSEAAPQRQSAKLQRASRGCFPAQWTKHFWRFQEGTEHSVHFGRVRGSWTDTSVLSHATRLITQPPSLRAPHLSRPFPCHLLCSTANF